MAKATKRKSPARRKPASKSTSPSTLAMSGWMVATALGIGWAGPHLGLWSNEVLERIPSFDRLRDMAPLDAPEKPDHAEPVRSKPPVQLPAEPRTSAAIVKKPVLPPLKPGTIAEIVEKAEAKPRVSVPKPTVRAVPSERIAMPRPPATVPEPVPFVTAAIREKSGDRAPTAKAGELPIRRYPFTTAPTIAYVADLRTLRILSGEGDWKKVEVSATGVVGWLRLQRLGSNRDSDAYRRSDAGRQAPLPPTGLFREADAASSR